MTCIDVLTLNIWNKQGHWDQRRPRIEHGIRELVPDLIGLQEVLELITPDGNLNQADEFVPDGYHSAYAPAQELGPGLFMGNALLSRFPIIESTTFELPGETESGESRSVLCTLVEHPDGLIPVYVTHLNWKLDQGFIRIRQVQRIHDLITTRRKANHLPAILMGDFNAEPPSDEIRFLKGFKTIDGKSVHYSDVWDYSDSPQCGATFDPAYPYAADAQEPPRRIDYIFVAGPDSQRRGHPREARIVLNQADAEGVWPSDHFGVWARIALADSTPTQSK